MAAGDLENILPTPTAKRTNNIALVDVNGNVYPVKEVHWSDANGVGHLIWQRDHSPTTNEYISLNVPTSQNNGVLFKWTATSSTINKIKIWVKAEGSHYNYEVCVRKSDWSVQARVTNLQATFDNDVVIVDGVETTVYTLELPNIGMSVEQGAEYIIFAGTCYATHWNPIVYKDVPGTYWVFSGDEWLLQTGSAAQMSSSCTEYNTNLVKAEVNGVQV